MNPLSQSLMKWPCHLLERASPWYLCCRAARWSAVSSKSLFSPWWVSQFTEHRLNSCVSAGGLLRHFDNQFPGAELQEKTGEREEDGLETEIISQISFGCLPSKSALPAATRQTKQLWRCDQLSGLGAVGSHFLKWIHSHIHLWTFKLNGGAGRPIYKTGRPWGFQKYRPHDDSKVSIWFLWWITYIALSKLCLHWLGQKQKLVGMLKAEQP